jgi:hypothetical protein
MNARQIKAQALEWHGIALDDAAAERLARMSGGITGALSELAAGSLFDTEPAHYDRAMVATARRND